LAFSTVLSRSSDGALRYEPSVPVAKLVNTRGSGNTSSGAIFGNAFFMISASMALKASISDSLMRRSEKTRSASCTNSCTISTGLVYLSSRIKHNP